MIERIKSTESEKCLEEIYSEYRDEFLQWAIRNHKCTIEEAKDVFQTSIIIFYENVRSGKVTEISTKVKTYLFGIGKNKILELLRAKKKMVFEYKDELFRETDYREDDIDEAYEENLKKVEISLMKLGDPCKSILGQFYYHKKSMVEIAEVFGYKNSDTVKNLKYKCLKRLRRIVKSDFGIFKDMWV